MADKFKQIRTFDGISASEYEYRHLHCGNLVDQVFAFLGGEFLRVALRLSGRAAMHTTKVARLRHLPDNQERRPVEIHIEISPN